MNPPDVWVGWPTVSPSQSQEMVRWWRAMGYKVAVLIDDPAQPDVLKGLLETLQAADRVIVQREWLGFPCAANVLCREAPGDIVVVVGDDVYPDPHVGAQEIGCQFVEQFPDLFGVMQPTGDKFASIHLCAVSPWIGRGFIQKAYEGKGPYWGGYWHYFSDQELQEKAVQLGVFQQREDLTQYHDHWQRKAVPQRPRHLLKAKRLWAQDKALFDQRQKEGFPG